MRFFSNFFLLFFLLKTVLMKIYLWRSIDKTELNMPGDRFGPKRCMFFCFCFSLSKKLTVQAFRGLQISNFPSHPARWLACLVILFAPLGPGTILLSPCVGRGCLTISMLDAFIRKGHKKWFRSAKVVPKCIIFPPGKHKTVLFFTKVFAQQ